MKTKIIGLSILTLALGLTITGCGTSKKTNKNGLTDQEIYEYTAINGINLLSGNSSRTVRALRAKQAMTQEDEKAALDNLKLIDSVLAGGIQKSTEKASTKEGYDKEYTITTTLLSGEEEVYTFYYNETLKEREEDHDEVEEEYKIKGLVVFEDVEYTLQGKRSVETEKDESENELEYKIIKDDKNYVEVKQEVEVENNEYEQEYEYTKYVDGKKVSAISLDIEKENNKLVYEVSNKEDSTKSKYKYVFSTVNKTNYIDVTIKQDKQEVKSGIIKIIVNEDDTVQYVFVADKKTK